jgi:hypothetical protein
MDVHRLAVILQVEVMMAYHRQTRNDSLFCSQFIDSLHNLAVAQRQSNARQRLAYSRRWHLRFGLQALCLLFVRSTFSPPLISPRGSGIADLAEGICGFNRFVASQSAVFWPIYFEATFASRVSYVPVCISPFYRSPHAGMLRHRLRPQCNKIWGGIRNDTFSSSPSGGKKWQVALRS